MKSFLTGLMLLTSAAAFSQTVKNIPNHDITGVRVYLRGAQVDRVVKTTVDAGITQLAITGLSPDIDGNSIYIAGTGAATILSFNHTLDYLGAEKKSPQLVRLQDSLETLENLMAHQNVLESAYNEEVGLLNANKNTGGQNTGVNAENLKKVADFYRTRYIELKTKLIAVAHEKKELTEKITKVRQQLDEINAREQTPTGTILVNVSAKQKTNLEMNVSYYLHSAGWRPAYDIRANDVKGPVTLVYKGAVTQNSGENWEQVKVTLSTGNPSLGGNRPHMNPWYLDFRQPVPLRSKSRYEMQKEKSAAAPAMTGAADANLQTMEEFVVVSESQVNTDFAIQIPYTIPSDGKEHMLDIQNVNLPATYAYSAVPKLDRDAFLMSKVSGWESLNLLPGQSKVYFENSYVGESYINPAQTTDTLELSLGRDKRISIKREKVKEFTSKKFIGSNIESAYTFEITVRNNKKDPITIDLEDQVPVSRNEAIKVDVKDTGGGKLEEETGKLTWRKTLAAGASEKIRFSFTVRHPKDRHVPGL